MEYADSFAKSCVPLGSGSALPEKAVVLGISFASEMIVTIYCF